MLFQLTMFPTDKGGTGSSSAVSRVIDLIDRSGYPYRLGAMSTTIEGDWDGVIDLVNRARKRLRSSHDRIYIILTIDDRKGAKGKLTGKIRSIEQQLGRRLSHA